MSHIKHGALTQDAYHHLFSDALIGYASRSEVSWLVENIDNILFRENTLKDS